MQKKNYTAAPILSAKKAYTTTSLWLVHFFYTAYMLVLKKSVAVNGYHIFRFRM